MRTTYVSPEIRKQFTDKMESLLVIVRNQSGKEIPTPRLVFGQYGRRGGTCVYDLDTKVSEIQINSDFFKNHFNDTFNTTLPHEIAHHVAHFLYGREGMGHGHLWGQVMRWFGLVPKRCHQMSLEGVKVRQTYRPYEYKCDCKSFFFTPLAHRKACNGRTYTCRKCHQKVVFQGVKTTPYQVPRAAGVPRAATKQVPVETFRLPIINLADKPAPLPEAKFRTVTRFVNGALVNERIPC